MCMDISKIINKEDLLRINKGFGGNLRSDSSIDFAFDNLIKYKPVSPGWGKRKISSWCLMPGA